MHNFKKAAITSVALVLTVIAVLYLYTYPYFNGTTYYYQDAEVRKDLSGKLDFLISGSSHGFRAFIPEIIDEEMDCSSYNLACAMQTMEGRYNILKKELERNDVNTVVFELSYNALTRNRYTEGPEGDLYHLGRLDSTFERISFFFTSFYPKEYANVFHDTLDRSALAWDDFIQGVTKIPKQIETKGYIPLDPVDYTVTPDGFSEIYHRSTLITEKDDNSVEYFKKCVELCTEKDVRLILVVTPITDKRILEYSGYDTVTEWYREYAKEYDCEFYDFNLIKTKVTDYPADTAFFDTSHLSKYGAETFTKQFCEVLNLVESGIDVSDMFYDSYSQITDSIIESIYN